MIDSRCIYINKTILNNFYFNAHRNLYCHRNDKSTYVIEIIDYVTFKMFKLIIPNQLPDMSIYHCVADQLRSLNIDFVIKDKNL